MSKAPEATVLRDDRGGSRLVIDAATASLCAVAGSGEALWRVNAIRFRDSRHGWQAVERLEPVDSAEGEAFHAFAGESPEPVLELHTGDDGVRSDLRLLALAERVEWLALDLAVTPEEHFVGLGERFDAVDQRGRSVDLHVLNGAVRDLTYKPIPFFMSSAGYGAHLQTDRRALVRLAVVDEPDTVSLRNEGREMRLGLITGQGFKEILGRYTETVGRPAVPPDWVFGPWKSRDWTAETQQTVLEDVRLGRKHRLAGTVKLIDALWEPETHTFSFDREKYPDPEGMIAELQQLGYRLVLWVSPFMVKNLEASAAYLDAEANGYLIRDPSGGTYLHRLGNSPTYLGSCIDFTNPAALSWWKSHIRRLVRMGVSGFKTDFGEQVPEDAIFFDGRSGRELHNVYPRLYNQATYEALSEELAALAAEQPKEAEPESQDPESEEPQSQEPQSQEGLPVVWTAERARGTLFARSAWDGSQGISAIWAGDQTSDFGPASGLQSVITAGQSAGLSGFPYWASDIGGYFGVPTDEVFARWTQFGAFSPIMQVHGMGKREPWEFSPETLEIYRRYAQLHLDLFPYIYTYAHRAYRTGLPIMRALALEFEGDPQAWGDVAEHEYMFGEELLVAPVYYGFSRYRHTYLPRLSGPGTSSASGSWLDFWSGAPFEGGRVHVVPAQIETIPVFARPGALIPMLDPSPQSLLPIEGGGGVGARAAGLDLRLLIYPGAQRTFELFDGTRFEWDEDSSTLRVHNPLGKRSLALRVVGGQRLSPRAADASGAPIPVAAGSLSGEDGYTRFSLAAHSTAVVSCQPYKQSRGGGD